ncbi:MAG: NlpC/P60 family protein [Actinomycetota bacterium]|nr:NlpC/P60 family protein [Actinomycetota bacterium]
MKAMSRPFVARRAGALLLTLGILGAGASGVSRAAPTQAEVDSAQARLMALEKEFELAVEEYNLVHDRLEQIRTEIATSELVIRRLERRMSTQQDSAVALAQELYMGGTTASFEAVLDSDSIAEVESSIAYLQSSQQAQAKVFERLSVDRRVLETHLDDLESARSRAQATEERLVSMRVEIEAKVNEQADEVADLNRQVEAAARRQRAQEEARARAAAEAAASDPQPPIPGSTTPTATAPNGNAQAAVDAALSQVGKPYQWGAAGPDSYDCSGLTMWAWAHAGVSLPHNSGAQYAATSRVAQSDWQPGDLLFYGSPIHHVGMYIGGGRMVEAPYTGSQVRVVSPYRSDYVGAGRP